MGIAEQICMYGREKTHKGRAEFTSKVCSKAKATAGHIQVDECLLREYSYAECCAAF